MNKRIHFAGPSFFLVLFMAVVVACVVLKFTSSVFIPLAIALFLSFVFEPLVYTLNTKLKMPLTLCILIVMLGVSLVLFSLGNLLFFSLRTIVEEYPVYENRFTTIYQTFAGMFDWSYNVDSSLITNLWEQASIRGFLQDQIRNVSSQVISLLSSATLIFLFMFFFLAELRYFKEKIEAAFVDSMGKKNKSIFTEIVEQSTRYVTVKFYISAMTGIVVYVGTLLIGLDFPVIWGFIAFFMNFIPTFGSIFAGVLTGVFALVQFWPLKSPVILTALLMLAVNQILGNIIEPKLQGKRLGISPFIIITSLSLWGWIWGFTGMILAVPIMVVLKIVCENIDFLYPVAVLMSSGPPEAEEVEKNVEAKEASKTE